MMMLEHKSLFNQGDYIISHLYYFIVVILKGAE